MVGILPLFFHPLKKGVGQGYSSKRGWFLTKGVKKLAHLPKEFFPEPLYSRGKKSPYWDRRDFSRVEPSNRGSSLLPLGTPISWDKTPLGLGKKPPGEGSFFPEKRFDSGGQGSL